MVSTAPRILLAVPTLGQRLELLQRTLASAQGSRQVVVDPVIVCPAASPELAALARAHNAELLVAPGHISAAVNRAFRLASAEHRYGAWIGDDDMVVAHGVSRAAAALDERPDAVMAYGDCDFINVDGATLFVRRPPPAARWLMHFVPGLIKSEACLFRLDALRQVGGLDESLRYAMDVDLILRLRRIGSAVRVPTSMGRFCIHADSITIRNRVLSFEEAQRVQLAAAKPGLGFVLRAVQPLLMRVLLLGATRMNARKVAVD